jgi:hypothetical protein
MAGGSEYLNAKSGLGGRGERGNIVVSAESDRLPERGDEHLAVWASPEVFPDFIADSEREITIQVRRQLAQHFDALGLRMTGVRMA